MKSELVAFLFLLFLAVLVSIGMMSLSAFVQNRRGVDEKKENKYQVEHIFTQQGCKVFRFYDKGERYFSDCRGSTGNIKNLGSIK